MQVVEIFARERQGVWLSKLQSNVGGHGYIKGVQEFPLLRDQLHLLRVQSMNEALQYQRWSQMPQLQLLFSETPVTSDDFYMYNNMGGDTYLYFDSRWFSWMNIHRVGLILRIIFEMRLSNYLGYND